MEKFLYPVGNVLPMKKKQIIHPDQILDEEDWEAIKACREEKKKGLLISHEQIFKDAKN